MIQKSRMDLQTRLYIARSLGRPAESLLCILLALQWKTKELDPWLWVCRLGVKGDGLRYSCSQDTQMYILYFLKCLCGRLDSCLCFDYVM